jgi:hypothetical protein
VDLDGYRALRTDSTAAPNALAAILLCLRNLSGSRPHCYFEWSEGHPLAYPVRYRYSAGETPPRSRGRCSARWRTTRGYGPPSTSEDDAEARPRNGRGRRTSGVGPAPTMANGAGGAAAAPGITVRCQPRWKVAV